MNDLATARLLVSMLSEEVLVERAIESLTDYKSRMNNSNSTNEEKSQSTLESLKQKILGKKEEPTASIEVEKPIMAVMSLLLKWSDKGLSPQEILQESMEIERAAKNMGNGD